MSNQFAGIGALQRWSRLTRKLLNLQAEPFTDICNEPVPVYVLANDRPEWAAIANERLGIAGPSAINTRVHRVVTHLFNPLPTQAEQQSVLVTLEDIVVVSVNVAARVILFRFDGVTSANRGAGVVRSRDTRLDSAGLNLQVWVDDIVFNTIAPAPLQVGELYATATDPVDTKRWFRLSAPIILAPGTGILVVPTVDATFCDVSPLWRERQMSNQELALP